MKRLREILVAQIGRALARPSHEYAPPEEIRSGAITPDWSEPGSFLIDANTARGLRKFAGVREIGARDPQAEGYSEETGYWQFPLKLGQLWEAALPAGLTDPLRAEEPQGPSSLKEPAPSPEKVLEALRRCDLTHKQRQELIIEAEALDFTPAQTDELTPLLRHYVETHRDSGDPEELVAVASAIRKYVATMRTKDLQSVAMLLDAGHNASVPLEIELELAKMLVRKLTANPPETEDPEPGLADRLMEVAKTYLNPRLLSRDKYGVVAINAALALLLLRSRHVGQLLEILSTLEVSWFTQLLVRRGRRLRDALRHRFSEDGCRMYLHCLDQLDASLAANNV